MKHANVEVSGAGPPVVLCGGLGGSRFDWTDTARILTAFHRVVVIERPGFGRAPAQPDRVPTVAGEAALIRDVLDELGITEPVALVGHSIASLYTEGFVRLYPERSAGLVVLDAAIESAPLGIFPRPLRISAARFAARAASRSGLQRLGADVTRRIMTLAIPPDGWDPDRVTRLRELYRVPSYLEAALVEYAVFPDLTDELAEIRSRTDLPDIPVVVAAAHTGRPTPWGRSWIARQRNFAEQLGARFAVIAPSHHHVMIDQPTVVADLVASTLL